MRHRYHYLDPELLAALEAELDLMRLFNQLVVSSGGDAERAMEWMKELQQRGFIGEDVDLAQFFAHLEESDLVERDASGKVVLATSGQRKVRQAAFEDVFSSLKRGDPGYHPVSSAGEGQERLTETRAWSFGDDLRNIDAPRSMTNALRRAGGLELAEEDLEVFETEQASACATVVAIDISHSMVLYGEDRITPAKSVALALTQLITSKYPKDYLGVIVFGDRATPIPLEDIAKIQAGPYHTNTQEALRLARALLMRRKQPNRQIFLITDGKPSAITDGASVYKNPFGLDMRIVNRTLEEVDRCRRHKVVITTFMLATDPALVNFVETLTRINRGRAYFASPFNLSEFVFADYLKNRRKRVR